MSDCIVKERDTLAERVKDLREEIEVSNFERDSLKEQLIVSTKEIERVKKEWMDLGHAAFLMTVKIEDFKSRLESAQKSESAAVEALRLVLDSLDHPEARGDGEWNGTVIPSMRKGMEFLASREKAGEKKVLEETKGVDIKL